MLTAGSISSIVTAITEVVTGATGWIVSYAEVLTSTPLLLFFCIMGVTGMGLGLFKRLTRI